MDRLAIVVPCYNEEEVLKLASKALRRGVNNVRLLGDFDAQR